MKEQLYLSYKFSRRGKRCRCCLKSRATWSVLPVSFSSWTETISICVVFNVAWSKKEKKRKD